MVISIHHYTLAPGVNEADFEAAVKSAQVRGLLDLSGLVGHHFVKGIKGARHGELSAIWLYQNRAAWEALWGAPDAPKSRGEYPESWLAFEDEVLAPMLAIEPEAIEFTSYEEI